MKEGAQQLNVTLALKMKAKWCVSTAPAAWVVR